MSYLKNGTEYLYPDELEIYYAIQHLNEQGRTTNNSQIANATHISRTAVSKITTELRMRRWIKDVSKGAAYHWRLTDKRLPDPIVPDRTPGPAKLAAMFPIGGAR